MTDTFNHYYATLVHGRVYTYNGVQYMQGERRVVDAETAEYLNQHAVDRVKSTRGSEKMTVTEECKFEFEGIPDEEVEEAVAETEATAKPETPAAPTRKKLSETSTGKKPAASSRKRTAPSE